MIDQTEKWYGEFDSIMIEIRDKSIEEVMEALDEELSGGTLHIQTGNLINSLKVDIAKEGFTVSTNVVYGVYWEASGKKPWVTNAGIETKLNNLDKKSKMSGFGNTIKEFWRRLWS